MKEETVEGEQYVASNGQQIEKYFDLLGIKISPPDILSFGERIMNFCKRNLIKFFLDIYIYFTLAGLNPRCLSDILCNLCNFKDECLHQSLND